MKRVARKSVYDGREFDSILELNAYKLLQLLKVDFTFHEHSFTLIEGYKVEAYSQKTKKVYLSKVQPITYTPEFKIQGPGNLIIYIEMKGFFEEASRLRWKMFKKQLKENEKAFLMKSNGDLTRILEIYGINGRIDSERLQQQFDL